MSNANVPQGEVKKPERYSVNSKSRDLAEHFLPPTATEKAKRRLAQAIQDAVEEHCTFICTDGEDHDWQEERESYGEDADGNRGVWQTYKKCSKCGEES